MKQNRGYMYAPYQEKMMTAKEKKEEKRELASSALHDLRPQNQVKMLVYCQINGGVSFYILVRHSLSLSRDTRTHTHAQ